MRARARSAQGVIGDPMFAVRQGMEHQSLEWCFLEIGVIDGGRTQRDSAGGEASPLHVSRCLLLCRCSGVFWFSKLGTLAQSKWLRVKKVCFHSFWSWFCFGISFSCCSSCWFSSSLHHACRLVPCRTTLSWLNAAACISRGGFGFSSRQE